MVELWKPWAKEYMFCCLVYKKHQIYTYIHLKKLVSERRSVLPRARVEEELILGGPLWELVERTEYSIP